VRCGGRTVDDNLCTGHITSWVSGPMLWQMSKSASPKTELLCSSDLPAKYTNNSTVVIWSGHIGSYEDQAPLLGKYLRKDLVNRGTLG
jgi:hypothetical protein